MINLLAQPNPSNKHQAQLNKILQKNNQQYTFKSHQQQLNFQNPQIRCSGTKKCSLICLNQDCNNISNPFICSQSTCQCQQQHQQCIKGNLSFITKKLKQKICKPEMIKQEIQSIFERMIDNISEFRDKTIEQIDTKLKYINLVQMEKDFIKVLQSGKYVPNSQQPINNQQGASRKNDMKTLWNIISQKVPRKQKPYELLLQQVVILQTKIQQSLASINTLIQFYSGIKENSLFQNSNIIDFNHLQTLESMFGDRDIIHSQLLYQASLNSFSLAKFYQTCGKVNNIMIVCKTNKGNVIGGYTPLCFDGDKLGDHYAQDVTGESFIFSLTYGDRFQLKNKNNAIYRVANKQRLCFGGCQFQICDKANIIKKCRSYSINYYYQNQNYKPNQKQSFLRFNGNQDEYFTVKQWQAWRVVLGKQKLKQE